MRILALAAFLTVLLSSPAVAGDRPVERSSSAERQAAAGPFLLGPATLLRGPQAEVYRYVRARVRRSQVHGALVWQLEGAAAPRVSGSTILALASSRFPLIWTACTYDGSKGAAFQQQVLRGGTLRTVEQTRTAAPSPLDERPPATPTKHRMEYIDGDVLTIWVVAYENEADAIARVEENPREGGWIRKSGVAAHPLDATSTAPDDMHWRARYGRIAIEAKRTFSEAPHERASMVGHAVGGWLERLPDGRTRHPSIQGEALGVRRDPVTLPKEAPVSMLGLYQQQVHAAAERLRRERRAGLLPTDGPFAVLEPVSSDREFNFSLRAFSEALGTIQVHIAAGKLGLAKRNLGVALTALARAGERRGALADPKPLLRMRRLPTDDVIGELAGLHRRKEVLTGRFQRDAGQMLALIDQGLERELALTRLVFRSMTKQLLDHAVGLPDAYGLPADLLAWHAQSQDDAAEIGAAATQLAIVRRLRAWLQERMDAARAEVEALATQIAERAPIARLDATLRTRLGALAWVEVP